METPTLLFEFVPVIGTCNVGTSNRNVGTSNRIRVSRLMISKNVDGFTP